MGAEEIEVSRSLVRDVKTSEMDVTIGLERTDDAVNCYLKSVLSGNNIPTEKKEEFSNKLKTLLYSKVRTNKKDDDDTNCILASLKQEYSVFLFCCQLNKEDNTLNIAYQFLKGNIEIQKAHKIKKSKIVEGSVEPLNPEQTKAIIQAYLGIENKDYLKKAIQDEKQALLEE